MAFINIINDVHNILKHITLGGWWLCWWGGVGGVRGFICWFYDGILIKITFLYSCFCHKAFSSNDEEVDYQGDPCCRVYIPTNPNPLISSRVTGFEVIVIVYLRLKKFFQKLSSTSFFIDVVLNLSVVSVVSETKLMSIRKRFVLLNPWNTVTKS